MARLQRIENALKEINETVFQELCDCYLALRNSTFRAFIRSGSQTGKQKTIKGTPDSFFLLPNGYYLFVEVTTVENIKKGKLFNKLKDDINKCLNEAKTGIAIDKIQEIILCFNSKLKTNEVEALMQIVENAGVYKLTLITLNELATQIHLNYRNLAKEYLNISLDTGQLVSLEKFIQHYNNKGQSLATPLDNQFVHREEELQELIGLISNYDFVILAGPPGVGKSKLALEGINKFLAINLEYNAYAVLDKNYDVFEDLNQYFETSSKNILFIDDANRYDRLSQIVGFTKDIEKGRLKIIITVRDYALHQLLEFPFDDLPKIIEIEGLTDEQLTDIIKSEPFDIKNPRYQKEIIRIADGNPRLAIMVAKLAIQKQNIYALQDVSDLFDQYFYTFIRDNNLFATSEVLKTLGLIAFFYTLPYTDDDVLDGILSKFKINRVDFINSISKLEQLELVEIKYDHVKIAEQNLATYFFYKVFIKEELLSFQDLLNNYFEKNASRFRDTVIPANNTFGYNNVLQKIQSPLKSYWNSIKLNEKKVFVFLDIFWAYLINESLEFIFTTINSIDVLPITTYNTEYKTNDFTSNKDKYLELLTHFYLVPNNLQEAIELSFEYVRRKPEKLAELIKKINTYLSFNVEDEDSEFIRQKLLFDFIVEQINQYDELYIYSFIALSNKFLKYEYEYTKGGRGNKVYLGRYSLQLTPSIKEIREKIWQTLEALFPNYPDKCFEALFEYSLNSRNELEDIVNFDLKFITKIISKHFISSELKHCFFVQEYAKRLSRKGINSDSFKELLSIYNNYSYKIYTKIDWNRLRDKDEFNFDNQDEYERLKEEEIRSHFLFNSIEEFNKFIESFLQIEDLEKLRHSNFNKSLDIIISENVKRTPEIGLQILKYFLTQQSLIKYRLAGTILSIANSDALRDELWSLLKELPQNDTINLWIINFLSCLPDNVINEEYIYGLENTIANLNQNITINFASFEKYFKRKNNLFEYLLNIIINKNENENLKIGLGYNFFKFGIRFTQDISLLKKAYLLQDNIEERFDYNGDDLILILRKDNTFLKDYLNFILEESTHIRTYEYKSLHVVWSLPDYAGLLDAAIDLIIEKDPSKGYEEHFTNAFFQNLSIEDKAKADDYIFYYIKMYNKNLLKMKVIFDVISNSRKEIFDIAFQTYIALNYNLQDFKEMSWVSHGGVYNGDVIVADIRAAAWNKILDLIEELSLGVKIIPIKSYVQVHIDSEKENANRERKRKFLEDRD
ncbi:MAG: ATP-binding protein [Adhaeribacter sp.]